MTDIIRPLKYNNDKILTDEGYKHFSGIKETIHDEIYKIEFMNNNTLTCSINHPLMTINGIMLASEISKYDEVITKDGATFIKSKRKIKKKTALYDIVNVENHKYITNNIVSHNCNFLGSSNTLISSSKLQVLTYILPIKTADSLYIYEQPQEGHIYVSTVDTAGGGGQDYSVITIFDVTESPYKQVLVYRNNRIDPTKFGSVVYSIAKKYNYSYLVIEANNDGKLVAQELWELEYENMINTETVQGGFNKVANGRRSVKGIETTKKTKRVGCSRLKELIENDILIVYDENTVNELINFVQKKDSYEADGSAHDDIVMTLVIFAWFCTTDYFLDINGLNVVSKIREINDEDEDLHSLLGFIDDGAYDESNFGFNF